MKTQITFRGRKAFPEGTVRDYGKYGKYLKQNGEWVRLKNGHPSFRKTRDYKKMKLFLLNKGYSESFFKAKNVKTLRALIKSEYNEAYYGKQ